MTQLLAREPESPRAREPESPRAREPESPRASWHPKDAVAVLSHRDPSPIPPKRAEPPYPKLKTGLARAVPSRASLPARLARSARARGRVRVLIVLVAAASGLWAGCGEDGPAEPAAPEAPRPTTVVMSPATASLDALGATVQLAATVLDQNGQTMAAASVSWSSGNAAVATVDASGLVTAAGNGEAAITAASGDAAGSAAVTVEQQVAGVRVTPDSASLVARGDTVRLGAEALDANGHAVAGAVFAWQSDDTSVATVDASGLVTAAGVGTATIMAAADSASGTDRPRSESRQEIP